MSFSQDALRCYRAACAFEKHKDAERFCIEKGWASDPADYDSKVYAVETDLLTEGIEFLRETKFNQEDLI